jgi:histidinol dehydrogenase
MKQPIRFIAADLLAQAEHDLKPGPHILQPGLAQVLK